MIKCLHIFIILLGFSIVAHAIASRKINLKICSKRNGVFPKPGSLCKEYYKCDDFVPEEWMCPPNHHFSTIIHECDRMESFPCLEKPLRKECPEENGKYLKRGTGCVYFIECCSGVPTEKKCPTNMLFDPAGEKCEWIERYTCIEDLTTDGSKTSLLFTTLEPSTIDERLRTPKETSTESTKYPQTTSISPADPSTIYDYDLSTSNIFEITGDSFSKSDFTVIQPSSKESPSPTDENLYTSTSKSNISITRPDDIQNSPTTKSDASPTPFNNKETTFEEIIQSTNLIKETISEEIVESTASIGETTPEEMAESSSTSIRETTPGEKMQSPSILIRETTPGEMVESSSTLIREITPEESSETTTLIRKTTSEEIAQPSLTSIGETTPEKTLESTTPKEIAQSTTLIGETSEEIAQTTTLIGDTSEEIAQSTTLIGETSEEIAQSTTLIGETSEKIAQSTTLITETKSEVVTQSTTIVMETTPEEIANSSMTNKETTNEEISKPSISGRDITSDEIILPTIITGETDGKITITEKVTLSTVEFEQTTDEPNIFCPEPFGYFPHPTNKHKFIGCVDNIPNVLTCPSGLIYNEELHQCVYG